MVATSLVLWALAAAAPPSLAQPDFSVANVNADVAKFAAEHLATELTARGVRVVSAAEITSLIGLERQKQLLGCSETATSCLTELANALGADGTLIGQIGRFGGTYQVNIKVVQSSNNEVLATWSRSISSEEKLIPELTEAADELAPAILAKLRPELVQTAKATQKVREHHWPLIPSVAAGGFAVAGGVLFGVALSQKSQLEDPNAPALDPTSAKNTRSTGELMQNLARVAGGLAVASVATAAVMYAVGSEPKSVSTGVALTPNGGGIVFTAVIP